MATDLTIASLLPFLGTQRTWFHATLAGPGIRSFTGMHWGTRAAALARLRDVLDLPGAARPWGMPEGPGQPTLYKAEIRPQRPLEIADGLHDTDHLGDEFLARGIVCQAQATAMLAGEIEPFEALTVQGIDALVYRNAHEDPGSVSVVPLTQAIVRLIEITAITENIIRHQSE
ncbi:hypothetical protein [Roseomonas haemaphysalidis]|uniref:RES domain-containing protein n=1 Tax=Roseomonas haemaphysalidis TaxID=2768162 RepID=A0ABS3KW89_9PROT|nr:hypothetical protein [Roseomonas haemaphysalidis]MBO1081745.1 hypothetical protein [Roseomonas haemaphysalidis]